MAGELFPRLSFPARVFPLAVWQRRELPPEKDGTWAELEDTRHSTVAHQNPGLLAIRRSEPLSARAKVNPGYLAENDK
jgi:hypothetical protein